MVFHIHGRPEATILREQIGLVVDLVDFSNATLVLPTDIALVTAKRQELEILSKKCTKASGLLAKISDGYKTAEASFAAGKVMRHGNWLSAQEWAEVQRIYRKGIAIPELQIAGVRYKTVRLAEFDGSTVTIFHDNGDSQIPVTALTDAQIERLNESPFEDTLQIDKKIPKEKAVEAQRQRAEARKKWDIEQAAKLAKAQEAEKQSKAAITDTLDFKGLRLRLPLRELPALVDRTMWGFSKLDILLKEVDLKNPNTLLSLEASDSSEEKKKNGFTVDQSNDFAAIGKDGFGKNAFWYSWLSTSVQFVDGQLAEIKVYGSHWTADKLKTNTLRWLEFADAGLRKKYGDPTKVIIPLSGFSIQDAQPGYVVFVSRWDIRNQTIYLGVNESNSRFTPMIIFQDNELMKKLDALGVGETKL